MATKNCPHCSKQVPVACKKCSCGHVFFTARKTATSTTRENADEKDSAPNSPVDSRGGSGSQTEAQPTRRSGRVTRERPRFYDALEYENQTRRVNESFKKIFVTVGSTKFTELVEIIAMNPAMNVHLERWETEHIIIQGGSSVIDNRYPGFCDKQGILVDFYDYKQNLRDDMEWADLIISHAGAGTTMEALDLNKPLIVVPNRNLMDDHQLELANKLAKDNHAYLTSIDMFFEDMSTICTNQLIPFPPRNTNDFMQHLNAMCFQSV